MKKYAMGSEVCGPSSPPDCGKTKRRLSKGSGKVIAGKVAKVVGGIGAATVAGIEALKNKDKIKTALSQQKKGGSVKTKKKVMRKK